MRCVLYLRMSTDRQEDSIPQQREALLSFAVKRDHEVVGEYLDEGISGDATRKRKGFQKMVRDAADGGFDRILCWDQSRFGRFDSVEAGSWVTPIRDAGVSLETIDGGVVDWNDFGSRITFAVATEGKNAFLRDLSRSSLRGMAAKIRAGGGIYGGSTPYGLRREVELVGSKPITTLVPDDATAPVVRRIFEEYVSTSGSLYSAVEMLNRDGIRSPCRSRWKPNGCDQWRRSSVRRILMNPIYAGDISWGRTASGKYNSRVGEEIVPRRPGQKPMQNVPIVHRDAIPAIIERDLFDRAQGLLKSRKKSTRRSGTVRPLSGLLTCGCCGSSMHVDGPHYRCSRGVDFGHGTRCKASVIRAEVALDALSDGLREQLLAPQRLRAVKARLEAIVSEEQKQCAAGAPPAVEKRIADLDREVADGVARIPLIPKGLLPDLLKRLDALRGESDNLKRQVGAIKKAQQGGKLPVEDRVTRAIAAANTLKKALRDGSPATLNHLFHQLGVRVKVSPAIASVTVDPVPDPESVESCSVSVRDRTSTNTTVRPSRATRSMSPRSTRSRRPTIR